MKKNVLQFFWQISSYTQSSIILLGIISELDDNFSSFWIHFALSMRKLYFGEKKDFEILVSEYSE